MEGEKDEWIDGREGKRFRGRERLPVPIFSMNHYILPQSNSIKCVQKSKHLTNQKKTKSLQGKHHKYTFIN
jgi:hypothetical protein